MLRAPLARAVALGSVSAEKSERNRRTSQSKVIFRIGREDKKLTCTPNITNVARVSRRWETEEVSIVVRWRPRRSRFDNLQRGYRDCLRNPLYHLILPKDGLYVRLIVATWRNVWTHVPTARITRRSNTRLPY